jgi:hypothetical protein
VSAPGARTTSLPPARSGFAALALAAGALAFALAGCGAAPPDVFLLTRSGSLPGARLTLLVNDGGTVRCNGHAPRTLPDPRLLDARRIAEDLSNDAKKDLTLPAPRGSLLRFRVRTQDGTVTFSDVDAARRPELGRVVEFARTVAQDVCGLAR